MKDIKIDKELFMYDRIQKILKIMTHIQNVRKKSKGEENLPLSTPG